MDKLYQCTREERHVFIEDQAQGICTKCPKTEFSFTIERVKGESGFEEAKKFLDIEPKSNKKEFENYLGQAAQYLNQKKFGEVYRLYDNALKLNIDNQRVKDLIAIAKKSEKSYEVDETDEAKKIGKIPRMTGQDAGLGILLMDVSGSMKQPAFKGAKMSRLEIVAKSAAYGIHSLKNMSNNEYAFLHIYKFDHEVSPISFSSIKYLTHTYPTPEKLEEYLFAELSKRNGQTDINAALNIAYKEAVSFVNGNIKLLGEYEVKESSTILKNGKIGNVKNVSVLLYTDGLQFVTGRKDEKIINPFKNSKELEHDILIGAFLGDENNEGCEDLQNVLSECVKMGHDTKQFFLINEGNQMKSFRRLFRMASGASGFCPQCMINEHQDKMN